MSPRKLGVRTPTSAEPGNEKDPSTTDEHSGEYSSGDMGPICAFMDRHFLRYNAREAYQAAKAYCDHLKAGGKVWLSMAGAMSTAGIGRTLAEMIRRDKVHAISCTGANLEEDPFLLVGGRSYEEVANYTDLTPAQELAFAKAGKPRVTDTLLNEKKAMKPVIGALEAEWRKADRAGDAFYPWEFMYKVLRSGALKEQYDMPAEDSWMLAAAEKNLPMFVPGFEDSTSGNSLAACFMDGDISTTSVVKSGLEGFVYFAEWYERAQKDSPMGMLQLGGGIAGDAPICAVPMLRLDLERDVRLLSYFAQVTDAHVSYGGYSGAQPREKVSWGKIDPKAKMFDIHSDASIVAPLMFQYILEED